MASSCPRLEGVVELGAYRDNIIYHLSKPRSHPGGLVDSLHRKDAALFTFTARTQSLFTGQRTSISLPKNFFLGKIIFPQQYYQTR